MRPPVIHQGIQGPYNVVAGWLGFDTPPIPRQRNLTRAGYRKTKTRRGEHPQRAPRSTAARQPQLF